MRERCKVGHKDGWRIAARIAKVGDRILDLVITLLILLISLYGVIGLLDAYKIYDSAQLGGNIAKYKPALQDDAGKANPTLDEMIALYPDTRAWLTIDKTNIDYPVMQGKDNTEYINTAPDGKYSLSGSLFIDYRNDAKFRDAYTLIYGHHMSGEYMFGVLPSYLEKEYFEAHLTGHLFLQKSTRKVEIFAAVYADAYDRQVFNPTRVTMETRDEFLKYIEENARQYRSLRWEKDSRILAMSTCSTATTSGRVIVFGKLNG